MATIKASELIAKYQGRVIFKKVFDRVGLVMRCEYNRLGRLLLRDISVNEIENDVGFNFSPFDYFGLMTK